MKKLLVLFGIILLSQGISFAAIKTDESANIDTLRAQGYSESALRVIDTVNNIQQGKDGKYAKYYTKKEGSNLLGRAYSRVKEYFDPIQDDGKFGVHQINFSNDWMRDETSYSSRVEGAVPVEDL